MTNNRGAVLRIGVLGAARITPRAVIKPAGLVDDVEVRAVAARDRGRAAAFAANNQIPRVARNYIELLADPEIDAIYNPLPNGLHGHWSIAALEAGKHVLCEKPFAANAKEAEMVVAVARRTKLTCLEAFPYSHHPLAQRIIEIVRRGDLGTLRHMEAWMYFPLLSRSNMRWDVDLAGGSCMDVGCYAIHILRSIAGTEPDVLRAHARCRLPGVDRWMQADLRFTDFLSARITVAMLSTHLFGRGVRVIGERGELRAFNPYTPHLGHLVTIRTSKGSRREHFTYQSSYVFQLRAFARAVLQNEPSPVPSNDAVANMQVIDAVYRAAGMEPRKPTRI